MKSGTEILFDTEKFKITPGLCRVEKALDILNHPEYNIEFIHVAGTNGKGSVCAMIESILLEDKKYNIGKYTSPHLFSYTERFRVQGENIKEDELELLIGEVAAIDKKYNIGLSEFEMLTVICFLFFKKNNVEIGILETGLGGRLDATNIIKKPLISIITSISYDHKEILGETIEKIAQEKAGIIKKGCYCAFLENNLGFKTLAEEAKKRGGVLINDSKVIDSTDMYKLALKGDFQKENLKLALLGIEGVKRRLKTEISDDTIKKALLAVRWKFRMDENIIFNKNVLIDGCHNPDGARALIEYIKKYHKEKNIKIVFGCLKNKDYSKIAKTLLDLKTSVKHIEFDFYEFDYLNALSYEDFCSNFPYAKDFREIKNPIEVIKKEDFELFVFCGSLYMLGKIFKDI